jgi:hypothetical protein
LRALLGLLYLTAFDRHSRAKRARVEATNSMAVEAQSEYRYLQRGIASISRTIETVAGRVMSEVSCVFFFVLSFLIMCTCDLQSTGLANVTKTYRNASATHLSSAHQATQALVEHGTREDAKTGTTPRKRVWEYVDQWELTRSRDVILNAWRQRGISGVGSETFLEEHVHIPEDELDENTQMGVAAEETRLPSVEPEVFSPSEYPITASLASSVSSMVSIPVPAPHAAPASSLKTAVGRKPSLPTLGMLTDSRTTNIHTTRGSRRAC